ncbi:MAG: small ribosomal subunit Rsm22 family protein [Micrococcales bacterium]|nr:small ribosomal subunit Rsm22 family protein [Micrococcales bacterium]
MHDLPPALRRAIDVLSGDGAQSDLVAQTRRLIDHYQSDQFSVAGRPLLDDSATVAAYVAYRMPATYAAVRAALGHGMAAIENWSPTTHLDLGGGTGAAVWAVHDLWPECTSAVLEQAGPAMEVGRRLVADDEHLSATTWEEVDLVGTQGLPTADLVTLSYVLGEIGEDERDGVVAAMAAAGQTVVIVEPGSKAAHKRLDRARHILAQAGLRTAAPCPHQGECPLLGPGDWCHFGARVNRSSMHRKAKGGTQSYEDEKFSYLVATRLPVIGAQGRVVRRPADQKGRVTLDVCQSVGTVEPLTISRRDGAAYKAARKAQWGDAWPPEGLAPDDVTDGEGMPPGGGGAPRMPEIPAD